MTMSESDLRRKRVEKSQGELLTHSLRRRSGSGPDPITGLYTPLPFQSFNPSAHCISRLHYMATRTQFENSSDVGVFSKLTNAYCLASIQGSTNFYSAFEAELGDVVSIVHTSIGGTRIVGRIAAGDHHGHLVPSTTTDQELQHLQNALPADDRPRRVLTVQS
ncbi:hypothetical protein BC826DRAFT_1064219 [Russula brevipes]|nr:hypothetical protein BC826DRAFT_1064219 [Russula brevipes]